METQAKFEKDVIRDFFDSKIDYIENPSDKEKNQYKKLPSSYTIKQAHNLSQK